MLLILWCLVSPKMVKHILLVAGSVLTHVSIGNRRAIALPRARIRHTKNTSVICRTPKTCYAVLPYLFLIHSFYTLLITLFIISSLKAMSVYIQLCIYCYFLIKSRSVFHVPVNCFARSIFYSSNINHQIGMVEHSLFVNYFMEKYIFILYISGIY